MFEKDKYISDNFFSSRMFEMGYKFGFEHILFDTSQSDVLTKIYGFEVFPEFAEGFENGKEKAEIYFQIWRQKWSKVLESLHISINIAVLRSHIRTNVEGFDEEIFTEIWKFIRDTDSKTRYR